MYKREQKCNPAKVSVNPSIIRTQGRDMSLPVLVWCSLCPHGPSPTIIFNYPTVDRGEDGSGEVGSATEVEYHRVQYMLMWLLFWNLDSFLTRLHSTCVTAAIIHRYWKFHWTLSLLHSEDRKIRLIFRYKTTCEFKQKPSAYTSLNSCQTQWRETQMWPSHVLNTSFGMKR